MKLIQNLFLSILFGSICFNSVKAEDIIYYAVDRNRNSHDSSSDDFNTWGNDIYTCNSAGECTFKTRTESFTFNGNKTYVDNENNLMMHTNIEEYSFEGFPTVYQKYDKSNQTVSTVNDWKSDYDHIYKLNLVQETSDGSDTIVSIGDSLKILEESKKLLVDGNTIIKSNSDGTIQIGTDTNDVDVTSQGISIGGNPLITRRANGRIHIGKNSLITTEEEVTLSDGRKVQPLYAEDSDGNRIPINIDGSKLLIDGVEVTPGAENTQVTTNKNNIKNLGEGVAGSTALTAALSALPQTSKESKLSCGIGTGAYSSRYAVGFGCASKVSERVDINAGGSYVFGGSKSYGEGTLDSGVVKAGFVFKLGELNKPTQISMNEKKEFRQEITNLKETNKNMLSKNQKLENKVFTLMARLERLEKVALGDLKSKNLAVYKLK